MLCGIIHKRPGRYEKALMEARSSIGLNPGFWVGHYSVGLWNVYLGRIDEGERALRAAAARGFDADEFILLADDITFLRDDRPGMARDAIRARARPAGENWMSAREAFAAAYSGHLRDARSFSKRAVLEAQQAGQPERSSLWAAGAAVREALFGNRRASAEWAGNALQLSHAREVLYGAALASIISGDSSHSLVPAGEMEKRLAEDSSVRFSYLPAIHALPALNRADPQRAVDLLQVADPHELDIPSSAISVLFGALYPIYVRGQAYLALKKRSEAAAEFSRIPDHRGIVVSGPIGALSRLRLGRDYALAGDKVKARCAYQDLLTLWKGGDQDVPVPQQAVRESANLR